MKHLMITVGAFLLAGAACDKKAADTAGTAGDKVADKAAAKSSGKADSTAAGSKGGDTGSGSGAAPTSGTGVDQPGASATGTTAGAGADGIVAIGAAVPIPPEGVTIGNVPPKVGDRRTFVDQLEVQGTINAKGQPGPMVARKRIEGREQVTAKEGDKLMGLEVTFASYLDRSEAMGRVQKDASLSGTYAVRFDGGKIVAERGGAPASAGDAEELVDMYDDDLGRSDEMAKLLAGQTWKPGQARDLSQAELEALRIGDDDLDRGKVSLTLIGYDGTHAVLELAGTMTGKSGPMDMQFVMKGQVKLDTKTGRALEFAMSGTMSGNGQGGAITFEGTLRGRKTYSFQ